MFGDRDDFADLWFTTKTVVYKGQSLPGLGMNIARYNLGACSWNSVEGQTMVASPNIPRFKQIETYWQDWRNTDPASSAWNWAADAKQRAAVVKAMARGAMTELFSNSPVWWMCVNHNPSGGASATTNNLQSWNYRNHGVHLAEVARHFRDHWGVTFRTISPFNEPASNYWSATGKQEGCHFDPAIQRTVLQYLRAEMNNRGLSGMRIAASDETSYDAAHSTWSSFDTTTRSVVNQINVHGYQGAGGRRDLVYSDARSAGKVLWNSEYGDRDGTGLSLASNLCLDWRWLHPTAWCFWQVMDPTPVWALIDYDPNTLQAGSVQKKLFVLAQFTRHIRPGMRIISASTGNAAVAYDPSARRLVLVGRQHRHVGPDDHLRPDPVRHPADRPDHPVVHLDDHRQRPVHAAHRRPSRRQAAAGSVRRRSGADLPARRRVSLSSRRRALLSTPGGQKRPSSTSGQGSGAPVQATTFRPPLP